MFIFAHFIFNIQWGSKYSIHLNTPNHSKSDFQKVQISKLFRFQMVEFQIHTDHLNTGRDGHLNTRLNTLVFSLDLTSRR